MWRSPKIIDIPDNPTLVNNAYLSSTGQAFSPSGVSCIDLGYRAHFEVLADDPDKRTRTWKACQHYRRVFHQDQVWAPAFTWYGAAGVEPHWTALPGWPASQMWNGFAGDGLTSMGSFLYPSAAFGTWQEPTFGMPKLYIDDYTGRRVVEPVNLEELIDRSLRSMLPGIKPRLSILNSIYELKDIPELLGTHDRIKSLIDKLGYTVFSKLPLSYKVTSLMDAIRKSLSLGKNNAPSDAFLAYKFGLGPMLQDMLNLQRALDGVRAELRALRENANKKLISHFRAALSDSVDDTDVTTNWSPSSQPWFGGGFAGRRRVTHSLKQFNASMEYSFTLPSYISDAEFEVLALADATGITFNPGIIWRAIPWSFVVDWVAGVGQWLDRFQTRNIEPVCLITKYCWSTHVKRTTECFITSGLSSGTPPMVRTSWIEEDAYTRHPANPDFFRVIRLSGLDTTKFLLGAALALSR
jgi:hypothetical protein